jgi:predicted alpha/beta-hydrolase family hydrolase
MLFVQGSRDALGDAREIRALLRRLPSGRLHVVEGADHSLKSKHLDAALDAVVKFLERPGG